MDREYYINFAKKASNFIALNNKKIVFPEEIYEDLPFTIERLNMIHNNILYKLLYDKEVTMSKMAEHVNMHRTNLTKTVDTLVEKGIVDRFQKNGNRKNVYIRLTPKGEQMVLTQREMRVDLIERKLSHLSEEEHQKISDALDYLNSIMEQF